MDPTSLYYTFTTIAQALAGAFGVLAAFAVLALSRIEASISSAQEAMLDLKAPYEAAWQTFRKLGFEEFLKRELGNSDLSVSDKRLLRLRRGAAALRAQGDLRRRLLLAAVLTAVDVGISIVLIPLVPVIAPSASWSVAATTIAVALAIVCLVLYGRVVVGAIRGV